jgi:zinc protease
MPRKLHQFQLNGAKIAVWPIREVEGVVCYFLLKGGTWYEKESQRGMFHLLEHLSGRATKDFSDPQQVEGYKEKYGIGHDAWTASRHMGYWFEFPAIYTQQAFGLIEQIIFKPIFKSELIANELKVIKQEKNEFWTNRFNRFEQVQRENITSDKHHPYCATPFDNLEQLNKTTSEDLTKFHSQNYYPNNCYLGIAGNIQVDQVKKQLKKVFNRPNRPEASLTISSANLDKRLVKYKEKAEHAILNFNYLLPPLEELDFKDRLTLNIAKFILSVTRRSLFHQRLRQELGLIYGISSEYHLQPGFSLFKIETGTDQKYIKKVCLEIRKIISNFLEKGVEKEKYQRIMNYMNLQTRMAFDSPDSIANKISYSLLSNEKARKPQEYIDLANEISQKQILNLLNGYLNWEKVNIGIMTEEVDRIPGLRDLDLKM